MCFQLLANILCDCGDEAGDCRNSKISIGTAKTVSCEDIYKFFQVLKIFTTKSISKILFSCLKLDQITFKFKETIFKKI